jgi:hypothetical protein
MKRNLTVAAALLIAALCQARDVRSPNGSYAIRAENSISLVDLESGSTLLVLDQDASGESRVEVAWAPNSMKVAIVEDDARGSVVLGAWTDERSIPADMASDPEFLKGPSDVVGRPGTWHKTIQDDNEKAIFSEAQRRFGGLVVAESRVFAGWISNDAIRVKGEIRLSSGKRCAYQYVAQFNPNVVGHLSKAGFKQGVLVGRNHQFLWEGWTLFWQDSWQGAARLLQPERLRLEPHCCWSFSVSASHREPSFEEGVWPHYTERKKCRARNFYAPFFERSFVDIQAASTVLAATRLKESGLGQTQHLPAIVNALAPQGALALIDDPDSLDIVPFKRKSLSVHWELMFTRSLFGTPNMDQQHRLLTEVGAGTLSAYELQRI